MSRFVLIGSFFGVVLTGAAAYLVVTSNLIEKTTPAENTPAAAMVGATDTAPIDSPPVPLLGYSTDFASKNDAIMHRTRLKPRLSTSDWDRLLAEAKIPTTARTTPDCRFVESEKAISVPPDFARAMALEEIYVHFIQGRIPRCYGNNTKLTVLIDDLIGGSTMYQIVGQITVDRLAEIAVAAMPPSFLAVVGLELKDVAYLSNLSLSPRQSSGVFFILNYSFSPVKPILDETKIPPFFPGSVSLKPEFIQRYFEKFTGPLKPVFLDARDRRNVSSGESYPGAIQVPFIASNPLQLRFQLDLPISVGLGAKFDLRRLPTDRETPLVIFGNDSSDAAPLWTIRYLRQLNYRSIFLVDGGLKALNEVSPPITL